MGFQHTFAAEDENFFTVHAAILTARNIVNIVCVPVIHLTQNVQQATVLLFLNSSQQVYGKHFIKGYFK